MGWIVKYWYSAWLCRGGQGYESMHVFKYNSFWIKKMGNIWKVRKNIKQHISDAWIQVIIIFRVFFYFSTLRGNDDEGLTWKACWASSIALVMNSSVIFLEGCSLNTEFISAIFAALLLASALVGQFCKIDGKIMDE